MTGRERREQLIDIGRRLFAERGFSGTSIEEIAAHAGVSKPVVYEHFGGKEGLYAVVVDRELSRFQLMRAQAGIRGNDARAKIEILIDSWLQYVEQDPYGFRILLQETGLEAGLFNTLIDDLSSEILPWIDNEFTAEHKAADAFIHITLGAIFHALTWWVENGKIDRKEYASQLTEYVWSGLLSVGIIERKRDNRTA